MADLLPPCFGTLWQATGDSFCDDCSGQRECLIEFVGVTLIDAVERLGGEAVPSALAAELRVPVAAIKSALEFVHSHHKPELIADAPEWSDPDVSDPEKTELKQKRKYKKPRVNTAPSDKPRRKAKKKPAKKKPKRKAKRAPK